MGALTARRMTDSAAANEPVVWQAPMTYKRNGSRRGVVHIHGNTGSELEAIEPSSGWYKAADAIARAGYPVVCPLAGGTEPLGNPLSVTRTGQAKTLLQSAEVGAALGKIFVSGTSGGFLTACNWARQNVAQVAGIIGFVFDPDLQFTHDNVGLEAAVDAAYGGHSNYLAALPTHDPAEYGPTALAGIPMLLIRSTDEPGAGVPAMQTSFIAAMQAASPGKVTVVTQTGGHALTNLDPAPVKTFLDTWA